MISHVISHGNQKRNVSVVKGTLNEINEVLSYFEKVFNIEDVIFGTYLKNSVKSLRILYCSTLVTTHNIDKVF